MFLGKQDIQLGVNETLRDSATIISSMMSETVARVGPHSDIKDLAKYSSVPVINGLNDLHHPLQTVADFLTMTEAFGNGGESLGLEGLKVAWVGDANDVLLDLAIGAMKLGVNLAVTIPEEYRFPENIRAVIREAAESAPHPGTLTEATIQEKSIKEADILVTDTWVLIGEEQETTQKMKVFSVYQITSEMAKRGGENAGWKFMHCLSRHPEEVSDEVL